MPLQTATRILPRSVLLTLATIALFIAVALYLITQPFVRPIKCQTYAKLTPPTKYAESPRPNAGFLQCYSHARPPATAWWHGPASAGPVFHTNSAAHNGLAEHQSAISVKTPVIIYSLIK